MVTQLQPDDPGWRWHSSARASTNFFALLTSPHDGLLYAPLPASPRRGGPAWIDVLPYRANPFDCHIGNAVARFPLTIQAMPTTHSWRAEAYPVVRSVSGVWFRCFAVEHPRQRENGFAGYEPIGELLSKLRYRADGRGGSWRAVRIDTSDETGNQASRQEFPNDDQALFQGLCLHEAAWKLGVTLLPVTDTATPDYVWHLRLPVPRRGGQVSLGKEWARGPIHLVASQAHGVGAFVQNNGLPNHCPMLQMTWSASAPFKLAVPPVPSEGTAAKRADISKVEDAFGSQVFDPAEVPPEPILIPLPDTKSHSVQLTLNVWRSRRVEFYATP